jgi:prevent-host-death family protein
MKAWKISDAKAKLSEAIASTVEEPQILYNRKSPVAALISYDEFEEYLELKRANQAPAMADLLCDLNAINQQEADLEILSRVDRANPELEDL